jgi:predicted ArsR family transcriptional regulator
MGQSSLDDGLAVVGALRDATRRALYRYIERQPKAVSRDEAAAAVGISRALAAFHLEKLVDAGLLRPEYRRLGGRTGPGAGRTSKLYRRSRRQFEITLPERQYELLARLLAEAAGGGGQASRDSDPAREYGRALGSRARRRIRGRRDSDRLVSCVEDVLETLGFDPYRNSADEIRLRNCPFDPLSRTYTPLVCGVGQAILRGVVEGVGLASLDVDREMQPERCCGVLSARKRETHAGASDETPRST